jgi:hypothetical protein
LNIKTRGEVNRNILKEQKVRSKILLIGDSHIKGLAAELNQNLGCTYEITGFVKANASVCVN